MLPAVSDTVCLLAMAMVVCTGICWAALSLRQQGIITNIQFVGVSHHPIVAFLQHHLVVGTRQFTHVFAHLQVGVMPPRTIAGTVNSPVLLGGGAGSSRVHLQVPAPACAPIAAHALVSCSCWSSSAA